MLVIPIFLISVITVLMLFLPFLAEQQFLNLAIIQTIRDELQNNFTLLNYILIWGIICVIIVVLTSFGITLYLSRKTLTPLKQLKIAADNIKSGNLDFEITMTGDSEMDELCEAFDKMKFRLKRSVMIEQENERNRNLLLANIAHDIRTPITSVKGYVEGILSGVADTPEKREHYLSVIYEKTNVVNEMIDNIQFQSKLGLKRIYFDLKSIKICEFLKNIIDGFKVEFNLKDIAINVNISDVDAFVLIDREQMRRVFANIIENSIKYKKEHNSELNISGKASENGYYITFSDNGIGITPDDLKHVFEAFYRGDESRNVAISGSGLGLSIAKQIIEAHSGKIWVKSEVDIGCEFNIYLPVNLLEKENNGGENSDN